MPALDLTRVLTGDWLGAALVAVSAFVAAVATSLGLLLVMWPNDASAQQWSIMAMLLVGAAYGADVSGEVSDSFDQFAGTVGIYPLTVTIVSLAVAGALMWRQLRSHKAVSSGVLHAVRVAFVFSILVTVPGALLRGELQAPSYLRDSVFDLPVLSGDIGTNVVALTCFSFMFMFVTCLVAVLRRRDWLQGRIALLRDVLVAPFSALAVMVLASAAVGVVTTILVFFSSDTERNATTFSALLATVPNQGILAVLLGGGVGIAGRTAGPGRTMDSEEVLHLAKVADDVSAWAWLLPLATALVFLAGAIWTVYRSGTVKQATSNLLVWVAVCVVAWPLLAHFAGATATVTDLSTRREETVDIFVGAISWHVVLLTLIASFVAAVIVTTMVRGRNGRVDADQQSHSLSSSGT